MTLSLIRIWPYYSDFKRRDAATPRNFMNSNCSNCSSPPHSVVRTLILSLCLCVSAVQVLSQDFTTVQNGVEYAQVEHRLGSEPVKINLLRLDLKKVRLDVHHALDKAIGLETTSSIAQRKDAIAAINAGFFRLDKTEFAGDAAGILVVDGNVWSESHEDRIAIHIRNDDTRTEVRFDHLRHETSLSYSSGRVQLSGLNRQRKADEMIAYTPSFGERTLTDSLGTEVVFRNCNGTGHCGIVVIEKAGNSPIPKDGFVLSIGPNVADGSAVLLERFKSKTDPFERRVKLVGTTGRPQFQLSSMDDITNGVPQLIRKGKIDITWEQEKASKAFAETRHPRSAVAKLKDGKFLMMTVDGRQPGVSVGMTLQELAEYLLSLGAVDAMNLDGGGSTTMFLDGKVVNTPSDKEGERKVGDAILVTLRKKSPVKK